MVEDTGEHEGGRGQFRSGEALIEDDSCSGPSEQGGYTSLGGKEEGELSHRA